MHVVECCNGEISHAEARERGPGASLQDNRVNKRKARKFRKGRGNCRKNHHVYSLEAHRDSDPSGQAVIYSRTDDEMVRVLKELAQAGTTFGDGHD